jgi:hypothetical protein
MQLANAVVVLGGLVACSAPPAVAPSAGNRCDQIVTAAVERAYRASGAATSTDGREAIEAVKVRRCVADQWPEGALDCNAHAATIPELQACRGKLLADQAHALGAQEALVRDDWEQFLADSESLKTKMCACPDRACATEVNKLARDRGLVKRPQHRGAVPAPEPPHDVAELVAKHAKGLEDCSVKLGGSPLAAALAKMRSFTDEMCQCKDSACAQKVSDEMVRWAQEAAKDPEWRGNMNPDEEDTKQMAAITQHMTECMSKAMAGSPPAPTP